MKPIIGIATDPFRQEYADTAIKCIEVESLDYYWLLARLTRKICSSVRNAGGIPVLLSATDDEREMEDIAIRFDGFVFSGGNDISPSLYGETNNGSMAPDVKRDMFEFKIMAKVIERDKPVLGICRGCQMINAVLGGTLYQHIPDINAEWTLHRRPDVMSGYVHTVRIFKQDALSFLRSDTMKVNSMHHQAIKDPATSVEVIADADGVIEGIYAPDHKYVVGVQWHPECLAEDDVLQAEIFKSLIASSK
jgi:putative glutamine amidotransferase